MTVPKNVTKYLYLIVVEDDVEPTVHGPYGTAMDRDAAAIRMRQDDPERRNGLFPLDITAARAPQWVEAWAYGGAYLGDENDD
jgi:hypothetical protein